MSAPKYANRRALFDDRKFRFGSVWKVPDLEIKIPEADGTGTRVQHIERWVTVLSNNGENVHPLCPIITVAPLTHRTELAKDFDLELISSNDNVAVDCLLRLKLSQPILKKDLFEYKGDISVEKKVDLQVLIEDYYGLQQEE